MQDLEEPGGLASSHRGERQQELAARRRACPPSALPCAAWLWPEWNSQAAKQAWALPCREMPVSRRRGLVRERAAAERLDSLATVVPIRAVEQVFRKIGFAARTAAGESYPERPTGPPELLLRSVLLSPTRAPGVDRSRVRHQANRARPLHSAPRWGWLGNLGCRFLPRQANQPEFWTPPQPKRARSRAFGTGGTGPPGPPCGEPLSTHCGTGNNGTERASIRLTWLRKRFPFHFGPAEGAREPENTRSGRKNRHRVRRPRCLAVLSPTLAMETRRRLC